jgi:hypothetical protein
MAIAKERQVNESPVAGDLNTLREFGHAINQLISGPPVVLTTNLPAASALLDGLVLVENAGGSNRNIVFYAGGNRYRISGGAAF